MKVHVTALLALVAANSAFAAEPAGLRGVWSAADGSARVRIAPCAATPERLCATVIADKPDPGERSAVGEIGMSDIIQDGANRWRGQYHHGAQRLPATLRLRGDRIDMRVCVGLFCSTDQYLRAE